MSKNLVILYSTSYHRWEVWLLGRPIGYGTLEACQKRHPGAPEPSEEQHRLAREDSDR